MTAKRERKGNPLVLGYLEKISSKAFSDFPRQITDLIGKKHGLYALYKGDRLYYVGLATNLKRRIKQHLKDKHAGKWNRFSLYLVRKQEHIKELESLILRIADPTGNATSGRLPGADNLSPVLNRKMNEQIARQLGDIFGTVPRKRSTKPGSRKPVTAKAGPTTDTGAKAPALAPYVTRRFMIRREYKGTVHKAWVCANGTIRYAGQVFSSPSWAARAVVKRNANGWNFWRFKNADGEWVKLAELRKKGDNA